MSWPERVYNSTQRPATITATKYRKTDFCSLQQKTSRGGQHAYDRELLSRGQGRKCWDFPHSISCFPVSSTLKYHKVWLALVMHTHFSTPRATEIKDFQVEKDRWMLLYTPDIIKHKTLHRGFCRAGEGIRKTNTKEAPTLLWAL